MTTQLDFKAFAQQIRAKAKDYPIDASSYDPKASFSTVTPQGTTWTVRCVPTYRGVRALADRIAKGCPVHSGKYRAPRGYVPTRQQIAQTMAECVE